MFKNYFKIGWRNLWKNKIFSLINIAGLSIGISAALVIYLIVSYDFSFDKFEKDRDRIYRVVTDITVLGETNHSSGVTYPMANAIKKEITGIDNVTHFYNIDDDENTKISIPQTENESPVVFRNQKNIVFADGAYFDLVPYTWLAGSSQTALAQVHQAVLSESSARMYYPKLTPTEIIGKKIIFNDSIQANVTGIVKDLDKSTDFRFKIFISRATLEARLLSQEDVIKWGGANSDSQLFVKLSEGTSTTQITRMINGLYKKYRKPGRLTFGSSLQPLSDIHFNNTYPSFVERLAHKPTLYGLLIVAGFLLLLGCINFINLTTAQTSQRAKEIGIRKTMGSSKKQLIFQFLGETFLLTVCAAVLSVAITPLLLKIFSDFIPEGLHFAIKTDIALFLCALVLIVSLLSGFYPALVLSSFKPVSVLKKQTVGGVGKVRGLWLRKSFTVSQFVIAQVFIIGTIIVGKQISYTLNKDLGFKKEAIIYLRTNYSDTVQSHRFVLMDKLKAIPEITMVSLASDPPSINNLWVNTFQYRDGTKELETAVQVKRADTNYMKLFNIKLIAGNNLSYSDTTKEFVINETYARNLGFSDPQKVIGKTIYWDSKPYPVVGVVSDFHQRSLHEPISPLVFTTGTRDMQEINIALQSQDAQGTVWKTAISKIEKAWKEVYPTEMLEYHFLDDTLREYYTAEQKISRLLMWSAGLTIFISCLGLLGLISYIAHQRTKEIGIRKVLGASMNSIIALFSKDFVKLVLIAITIASPLAWWFMHRWLQQFAYRIEIQWWMFAIAGSLTVLIASLTVGIQAVKAALTNPVKSLRTEWLE